MVFDETLPGRPCFSDVLPKPGERHFGCRHLVADNFFAGISSLSVTMETDRLRGGDDQGCRSGGDDHNNLNRVRGTRAWKNARFTA